MGETLSCDTGKDDVGRCNDGAEDATSLAVQKLYTNQLWYAQNSLDSTRFPVVSPGHRRRVSCQLVADLLATRQTTLTCQASLPCRLQVHNMLL